MKSVGVANRQSPIIQLTRLLPHESFFLSFFLSFSPSFSFSLFLLTITTGYFQPSACRDFYGRGLKSKSSLT